MAAFVPEKYNTLQDSLEHFGWTKQQINAIDEITKNRYQNWVREGNNLVETTLFKVGNDSPLLETSKEYAYAKSAALNWVVYKKRDKEGSRNATNAKDDHEKDLKMLIDLLTATRTDRTKTVAIIGKTLKKQEILLPSQIDTQFY